MWLIPIALFDLVIWLDFGRLEATEKGKVLLKVEAYFEEGKYPS